MASNDRTQPPSDDYKQMAEEEISRFCEALLTTKWEVTTLNHERKAKPKASNVLGVLIYVLAFWPLAIFGEVIRNPRVSTESMMGWALFFAMMNAAYFILLGFLLGEAMGWN